MQYEYKSRIRNALDIKKVDITNNDKLDNSYNPVPVGIKKFNWGACILTPFWGLFNNTPIACLSLLLGAIPFAGWIAAMGFSIYCGIKGNVWAWKNNQWQSEEQFHKVQRKWALASIILELIFVILLSLGAVLFINELANFDTEIMYW